MCPVCGADLHEVDKLQVLAEVLPDGMEITECFAVVILECTECEYVDVGYSRELGYIDETEEEDDD